MVSDARSGVQLAGREPSIIFQAVRSSGYRTGLLNPTYWLASKVLERWPGSWCVQRKTGE